MEKMTSICRMCTACCPIEVTTDGGRVVKVVGDRASDGYGGYSCAKGRALGDLVHRPNRLLQSQKRVGDSTYAPIPVDEAIGEIADRLRTILDRHGPRAVASFTGTRVIEHGAFYSLGIGFMAALGSPMQFSPLTLDQPGDLVAHAHHGTWLGGEYRLEECDTWLLVGTNPVVSHQYFANNPLGRIVRAVKNGARLVVIDPRRSETARHAAVHLQPRPGEDYSLLAGILALLFEWDAIDHSFVERNVSGVDMLRAAVAPYTPEYVCRRADVPIEDFEAAARIIAESRKGGAYCGTGTSMSNMGGNLGYYLALALHSLRGWWAREGDEFLRPHVLLPEVPARAQARGPFPASDFGEPMRARGLRGGVCGVPASALFDEILLPGEGQIKALFNMGGNPLMAIPDTARAYEALSSLELYVTTDVTMSANARLADYVIAVKMGLEAPTTSYISEALGYMHRGMGLEDPFAQYAPAVIDPPRGSDLIEDWQLYYRLGKALGLDLFIVTACGLEGAFDVPPVVHPLDMENEPSTDDILRLACSDGRISWDELTADLHGRVFEHLRMTVGPPLPDCPDRLDVGAEAMLRELEEHWLSNQDGAAPASEEFPFLLVGRRSKRVVNGTGQDIERLVGEQAHNPAHMHPDDMDGLGLSEDEIVEIRSAHGIIDAVISPDPSMRPGVIAMTHAFGRSPADRPDVRAYGSNTNHLLSLTAEFDRVTGMPRMGAVRVDVVRRGERHSDRQSPVDLALSDAAPVK